MIIYRIVFSFTDLIFFLFRSAQRRSIGHVYLTPVSLTLKFNMVTKVTNLYLLQISDLAAWFGYTIYLYRNHRFQYGCMCVSFTMMSSAVFTVSLWNVKHLLLSCCVYYLAEIWRKIDFQAKYRIKNYVSDGKEDKMRQI